LILLGSGNFEGLSPEPRVVLDAVAGAGGLNGISHPRRAQSGRRPPEAKDDHLQSDLSCYPIFQLLIAISWIGIKRYNYLLQLI
jgi:hypothetical protein